MTKVISFASNQNFSVQLKHTKMKISKFSKISIFIGAQLFDLGRSASDFEGETFTATQTYVQSTTRMTCPKLSITNGATCENDNFEHNQFCNVKCATGYELRRVLF